MFAVFPGFHAEKMLDNASKITITKRGLTFMMDEVYIVGDSTEKDRKRKHVKPTKYKVTKVLFRCMYHP